MIERQTNSTEKQKDMNTIELTSTASGKKFLATYEMYHPAVSATSNAWYKEAKIMCETPFGKKEAFFYTVNDGIIEVSMNFQHEGQTVKVKLQGECPAEIKAWYFKKNKMYQDIEREQKELKHFLQED